MKQLVKNILNFIHILIVLFYFLPLFTNKRNLLIVYLILNFSVLLKWYVFNGCWLTQIQNRIEKKKTLWLPRTIKKITPKKMHDFIDEYFPFIHDTIFIGLIVLAFYKLNCGYIGIIIAFIIFNVNYIKHDSIFFKW